MFFDFNPLLASGNSGELFRMILPFALAGILVLMALHLVVSLVLRGSPAERTKWNLWDILIYLGTLGCVAVLAVTAFAGVILYGALGGWLLFLHMFGAGAFTAVLPLVLMSWAHTNQFDIPQSPGKTRPPKFTGLSKLMFWTIIVSGLVVTMTMLVSMLPLFGSDDLLILLDLHRYSGLVVVAALTLHFHAVATHRLGLQ